MEYEVLKLAMDFEKIEPPNLYVKISQNLNELTINKKLKVPLKAIKYIIGVGVD